LSWFGWLAILDTPGLGVCFLPSLPIVSRVFGFFVGGFGDLPTPTSGFLLSTLGLSLAAAGAVREEAGVCAPLHPSAAARTRHWSGCWRHQKRAGLLVTSAVGEGRAGQSGRPARPLSRAPDGCSTSSTCALGAKHTDMYTSLATPSLSTASTRLPWPRAQALRRSPTLLFVRAGHGREARFQPCTSAAVKYALRWAPLLTGGQTCAEGQRNQLVIRRRSMSCIHGFSIF